MVGSRSKSFSVVGSLPTFGPVLRSISTLSPLWWLLAWVLVNLVTAAGSPIDADEAYYWMYAHQLDWGYYDHPPVVAVLIKLGMDWLPGALGLRFGHVLAGGITAWLLFRLIGSPRGKDGWLAALLIAALPMLQVYGFIATPDGPLLLFSALLLVKYKSFLDSPTYRNGWWLSLIMAALLYSKYQGVLLIVFLILPQLPWLVRQPAAWLSVIVGAMLYLPHLYWQYINDYPSFRYHLSGRNDPYELEFTLEYLVNQLIIFNPFLIAYYFQSLRKPRNVKVTYSSDYKFLTSCRWLVIGVLGFFLYSTYKGGTEAHWTAMLTIPLFYLLWQGYRSHPGWRPWLLRIGYLSLAIFFIIRLLLIAPREWLPFDKPFDAAPWVEEIAEKAEGRPVIFENSYRDASHYRFYTDDAAAWTFTDVAYRTNQFDLWPGDTTYHGQDILMVGKGEWEFPGTTPFNRYGKRLHTKVIPNWQAAANWMLAVDDPPPDTLIRGSQFTLAATIMPKIISGTPALRRLRNDSDEWTSTRDQPFAAPLDFNTDLPLHLYAIFQIVGEGWTYIPLDPLTQNSIGEEKEALLFRGQIAVPEDLPQGEVIFQLGLGYDGMPPLRGQSELWPLVVR